MRWAGGERRLTDLRHIAQLLHAAAMEEDMGVAALTGWLRRRIATAAEEGDEERSRRLESDAQAVQVLTIHRSKGLEFPVVYLPYLWHPSWITDKAVPVAFHDGDVRKVDVGLAGPSYRAHKAKHTAEQRGEDLRLAYVALTRAQHQAVVWWAGTRDAPNSPLGRLVFAREPDGSVAENGPPTPDDEVAFARFEELAANAPGAISVARAEPGPPAHWTGSPPAPAQLDVAIFDRRLDRGWRRTSYSDITAAAHDAWVGSEPEQPVLEDEPGPVVTAAAPDDGHDELRAHPSLWADLPTGANVGTLVHLVMEETDFAARDLTAELDRQVGLAQARRFTDVGERATVVAALKAAIETPVLDGRRLADFTRADRLDELRFELPLVGGDAPTGRLAPGMIGAVLREHLPPDDPLAGYAERLDDAALRQNVRGYLTGSIDLVLRTPEGRFAIADYKTNWLAPPGEPLTLYHHRPAALRHEMERAHYGLQALLYTVALHRYLRWRLHDYDPAAPPGRRPVPVRARHGRPRHAGGRRARHRRLRLAADRPARAGAQRRPRSRSGAMTDVLEPYDARRARGARGLLADFNDAGVLVAADVHVAQRLAALTGERDDSVLLAAALAVRGPRLGHTCVDLATIETTATVDLDEEVDLSVLPWPQPTAWLDTLRASDLVAVGEDDGAPQDRPLRLVDTTLYLDRYWREERLVAADLRALGQAAQGVDEARLQDGLTRLFATDDAQRDAAAAAVRRRFAVVGGGPGTGKTTTVARIVALLLEQAGDEKPLIALAAPTGKAAARLEEAVHVEAATLDVDAGVRERLLGLHASTLHRLLGWRPDSHSRFRHNATNRLPHDAVIVDETSMVSLSLMASLVQAVRPGARLILVGDPGQLTSIEAGAVLGDIVGTGQREGVVVLERVHRYGGEIAARGRRDPGR